MTDHDADWLDYVESSSDEPGWAHKRVTGHLATVQRTHPHLYPSAGDGGGTVAAGLRPPPAWGEADVDDR